MVDFRDSVRRPVYQWDQGPRGRTPRGFEGAGSRVAAGSGGLLDGSYGPPQEAGPVETGFVGEAQFGGPEGSGYSNGLFDNIMQPPYSGFGGAIPLPNRPGGDIFSYAPGIDGEISNALLSMDPFPDELVPPFRVRPGMNGGSIFMGNGSPYQANLNFDDFGATTREVQPEELVSWQLQQLIDGDSAYMQNADTRGRELANDRGALSSSIFAGSAQRAAIDAALPIASQDAQAYIRAATENMAALNQNTLAKLQSATSMAVSNAQIAGQMGIAQLANDSRERIAETQLNAQYTMQQAGFVQQQFMEQLQQGGRLQLSMLGFDQQRQLANMGFAHDINMSNLSQAQRIQLEEMFGDPRFEAQMQMQQAQIQAVLTTNFMTAYMQGLQNMNGLNLDEAARERGYNTWGNFFRSGMDVVYALGDANNWPDFNFNFDPPNDG